MSSLDAENILCHLRMGTHQLTTNIHTKYSVAEQFRALHRVHPGRQYYLVLFTTYHVVGSMVIPAPPLDVRASCELLADEIGPAPPLLIS